MGEFFFNLEVKNAFLNMTQNPESIIEKTDKFDCMKLKSKWQKAL